MADRNEPDMEDILASARILGRIVSFGEKGTNWVEDPETRLMDEGHENGWDIRNAMIDGIMVHANSAPDGNDKHRARFNFAGQAYDITLDWPVHQLSQEAFAHTVRELKTRLPRAT